jgi:hypothetical protein
LSYHHLLLPSAGGSQALTFDSEEGEEEGREEERGEEADDEVEVVRRRRK